MEIVIPPRDHGPSTYQYTWDENGEVTQITRVKEDVTAQERLRRGRQTVQWPFQSISTETEISHSPITASPFARRATWEPKRALRDDDDADSIARDLIPDYVINYIRGETPETVARRKRNGGKLGERGVDIAHQHRPHQSRTADFEGFLRDGPSRSGSSGADPNDESRHILSGSHEKGGAGRKRFTVGWRAGVGLNLILSFMLLLTGFVCLVVAFVNGSSLGGNSVFYSGSCTMAFGISWGLHALVNLFAVAIIAGANYSFQVLSSPTRTEVAAAHQNKRWLDIGIPSIRNLVHIEKTRTFLAVVLLVTAVATQIIYNAVISTSQSALDYKLVLVTNSFLTGAPFSNDTTNNGAMLTRLDILALQQQASRSELVNLTAADCVKEFSGTFETTYSAALLITNLNSETSSLIQTSATRSNLPSTQRVGRRASHTGTTTTGKSIPDLTLDKSSTQYCLAQLGPDQTCDVSVNASLLCAVALLNLVSVASLAAVLFLTASFAPLATLGDAISSFLQDPDPTTRGSCLLSKTDVWQGRWGSNFTQGAKYWVPKDHFWLSTASLPRWVFVLVIWLACAGLTAAALAVSVVADPKGHLSRFGFASPFSSVPLPDSLANGNVVGIGVIAALPQILMAMLYLAVNSLLTTCWLSHESSLFAVGLHRSLRVSSENPEGSQTSSLYLTLPRPVSWLLVMLFAGMGFVLSQSVFVLPLRLVDVPLSQSSQSAAAAAADQEVIIAALAFSGVGLFVFLGLLILLMVVLIVLGLRRAPAAAFVNGQAVGNPMVLPAGSCSAVISSRCHQNFDAGGGYGSHFSPTSGGYGNEIETELWTKPLVWGVVRQGVGMNVSHATFTAGPAALLDVARSYA
ncbi:hypothetical protein B0H66DRAFT_139429 [Apodospora peruviana]|uniref:DUF6536 domain-containing protein n=1 Tax=Apodospora peruviana TaxID=516989 RepID=A0AAE0IIF8_9PEZI|nr:hypothetical protein B0H66DRAFT_139429 [Apodospora peruviana]